MAALPARPAARQPLRRARGATGRRLRVSAKRESYGRAPGERDAKTVDPDRRLLHVPAAAQAALGSVSVVLCRPQGPQNVGSVARVAQNFGLGADLRVVAPHPRVVVGAGAERGAGEEVDDDDDHRHDDDDNDDGTLVFAEEARLYATGASWVLDAAEERGAYPDALAATEDATFVVATSARRPDLGFAYADARDAAPIILEEARRGRVAVLFGNERVGLTAEEQRLAHLVVGIPTAGVAVGADGRPYTGGGAGSLNLSQAACVVLYELFACATGPGFVAGFAPKGKPGSLLTTAGRDELVDELVDALVSHVALGRDGGSAQDWRESMARLWRYSIERLVSAGPLERRDTKVLLQLARRTNALERLARRTLGEGALKSLLQRELADQAEHGRFAAGLPTTQEVRTFAMDELGLNLTKREIEAVREALAAGQEHERAAAS